MASASGGSHIHLGMILRVMWQERLLPNRKSRFANASEGLGRNGVERRKIRTSSYENGDGMGVQRGERDGDFR